MNRPETEPLQSGLERIAFRISVAGMHRDGQGM